MIGNDDRRSPLAQADFKVGDVVDGRYELRRDLGRGAAGRVFEAVHWFTGRNVAIKFVPPGTPSVARAELTARLTREARALAAVRHPGVVTVYDGGVLPDGTPFVVLEMLEGRTLEGLITTRGKLSVEDSVAAGLQLALALEAAHAAGVVHRDLNPSNILVVRDHARNELLKVIDFGIARVAAARDSKLTGIGAVIGTPSYMAPEQFLAFDDIDARSDVYALGVTLFECLTGRLPYEGTYPQVLLQVCSAEAVPTIASRGVEVPAEVAAVVAEAMVKDRNGRFATMTDLRRALEASLPASRLRQQTHFFGPPPSSAGREAVPQRRKLVRASYVTPVRLLLGDLIIDGRSEDISTGGLLVVCRQDCPPNQRGSVRFALPIEGKVVALDVHVRWVRAARSDDPDGPRAFGVEFIDPPADVTSSITKYVGFMTVPEAP